MGSKRHGSGTWDPAGVLSEAQAMGSQPSQPIGSLPIHLSANGGFFVWEQSCWGQDRGETWREHLQAGGSTSHELQLRKHSLPCLHGRKEFNPLSSLLTPLEGDLLCRGWCLGWRAMVSQAFSHLGGSSLLGTPTRHSRS